ncbi:Eco57I restriction-modification methylase domain-containing protein [Rosistilla oblonga]|uniref:Eco57I restriction-modification methylase domain-containing protein n=1 Tax=Rosistilla oblonga TaxID=2527990 RepID=UPI003A974FFB
MQLIYAPRGENAGRLTFPVGPMGEIPGRPIVAALEMLLSRYRLLAAPTKDRLPGILKRSRDYQARVSNTLSGQVLDALYEMLRGFQAADNYASGELLKEVLAHDPDKVYQGLLTVLMRSVFLLYAEDQSLMPDSDLYNRNYSVHGLYQRLRNDYEQHPDTMENRYGAWAQLLVLFRLVYSGNRHNLCRMPPRDGHLFNPNRYPFLEGRRESDEFDPAQPLELPLVPDGTIFRVLEKLLVLDGERLSYRTLDVEQIGSVYETMIGFGLETATGPTIALRPGKSHGAPVPISLTELLETKADKRSAFIKDQTDYKLTANMNRAVKAAESIEDLLASLENRIARSATPGAVPAGTMLLVPTDERRRSGSHYTPRSLTEPIVRTTLEPIFDQMGESPLPTQILDLKICDPAMGSGAFLVEACRQLAEKLVESWAVHGIKPYIPPDEDELLHARRLVAQRCLYGVDKNPMAVDLAKLSLWLTTLAKDHPFTFVDHSLRCGDSLVGLTRKQIASFHWDTSKKDTINRLGLQDKQGSEIEARIKRAGEYRKAILEAGDDMLPTMKQQKLKLADDSLNLIRVIGDACLGAFFSETKKATRTERCDELFAALAGYLEDKMRFDLRKTIARSASSLHERKHRVTTFHWEVEFPEVFARENVGFDAFVGNPPFVGGARIWPLLGEGYPDWLREIHEKSNGKAVDLVAHFFRRTYSLLRVSGCFGLVATNSIAQGDSREAGLAYICRHNGHIYQATRRLKWPGQAAVIVSVIHVRKSVPASAVHLNGKQVAQLNSYLFNSETEFNPVKLAANKSKCFQGACVLGMGFTFDDTDTTGAASTIDEMEQLIAANPLNAERIFPYIGGKQINTEPQQKYHRYVIDFGDMSLEEAERYPDLLQIIRTRVKPSRDKMGGYGVAERRREAWWQFGTATPALNRAKANLDRVIAIARISNAFAPTLLSADIVFNEKTLVFPFREYAAFANVQCRVHETWARFFGSTLKDDFQYTPGDCFETYPLPDSFQSDRDCENAGRDYYEHRAKLLVKYQEGLTQTYNRFHSPTERDDGIAKLRELHEEMDQAVLRAYDWDDLADRATCEFLLDYEEEEDEESETGRASRRRKPYRYRWPDEFRDEVLARLLELNATRAEEERRQGLAAEAETTAKKKKSKAKKKTTPKKPRTKKTESDTPLLVDPAVEERNCLVYLLAAWNKRVSQRLLGQAAILMLSDDLRTGLLNPKKAKAKPERRIISGLDFVLAELEDEQSIVLDNSGVQQMISAGSNASAYGQPNKQDAKRIAEVMQYVKQRVEQDAVQETGSEIDAEHLIPVG